MFRRRLFKYKVNRVMTSDEIKQDPTTQESVSWGSSILGIPDIWYQTQGKDVNVAILDTGCFTNHPDLIGSITKAKDFTGSPVGYQDTVGHGTHVAGIIGARMNDIGFIGVAPECNLMIGKVLSDDGYGDDQWIANGIIWAVDEGAHIINMSLGGTGTSKVMFDAVYYALSKGVIICCAAGNEGNLGENTIGYPGRYGGVISVASHDWNGQRSGFSSRGGEVTLMAPGDQIWSTYLNGEYAELSGTSMASPFVAGLCALILAKHLATADNGTPIYNCEDMKQHLVWMTTHAGWHDNAEGYGCLLPFQEFPYSK